MSVVPETIHRHLAELPQHRPLDTLGYLLEAARLHRITWLLTQGDVVPADLAWAGELAAQAAG